MLGASRRLGWCASAVTIRSVEELRGKLPCSLVNLTRRKLLLCSAFQYRVALLRHCH